MFQDKGIPKTLDYLDSVEVEIRLPEYGNTRSFKPQ